MIRKSFEMDTFKKDTKGTVENMEDVNEVPRIGDFEEENSLNVKELKFSHLFILLF